MGDNNSQEDKQNILETAKQINKRTDEYWIKFVKWLWLFVIFYVIYSLIF